MVLPARPLPDDLIDLSDLLSKDEAYAAENDWFFQAMFDVDYMKWEKDAEGFYLAVWLINPQK